MTLEFGYLTLNSLTLIRVLSLVLLCVCLGSCTPIIEKVAELACKSPGIPCDPSGQACCAGYQCTRGSASEKAYCVQKERLPFIMARSGVFTGSPPQFMGMDTIPSDVLARSKNPEEALSCRSNLDCQAGYDCSQRGKCFPAPTDHPTVSAPYDQTLPLEGRDEPIVCWNHHDCPVDYRCSQEKESWNGVCTTPGQHHGWLINRRDSGIVQKEEKKKLEFPELPTTWCTQEGCPCYYTSPCEMGICDSYDERMIGRCRKFQPGEDYNLQPGFPIDTVRCTYTGCPCNKWYDHCWNGACDGLNRPGFGKCRPFSPMEEPRNNRQISEECTDAGCVCDGDDFPCKNSQCIIKGVNKYGRCRRFDSNGKMLHTRQEFDARCRTQDCPCHKQDDCLQGICADYNTNGIGRCKAKKVCTTCHLKRGVTGQYWDGDEADY